MLRILPIAGLAAVLSATGCAGTWDTLTSRSFRDKPFGTMQKMCSPEDPVGVLSADPPRSGGERADAMRRLKEPLRNGGTQDAQNAMLDVLAKAATVEPSPVLRLSAIESLGRFEDQRVAGILIIAYNEAHGRSPGVKAPTTEIEQTRYPGVSARITDRTMLTGPVGYSPDTVSAIRCRVLDSLGRTDRPEAVNFLAHIATAGNGGKPPEGSEDRDVRLAAVRGLAKCRQPESVIALTQVMTRESGKDGALVGRSHDGLVKLTGKNLPPDPVKWNEVIQAGNVQVVPEPNLLQQAFEWIKP